MKQKEMYVLIQGGGEWEDSWNFPRLCFTSKSKAEKYKEKIERIYDKCYNFYDEQERLVSSTDRITFPQTEEDIEYGETDWGIFQSKKSHFEGRYFNIQTIELR